MRISSSSEYGTPHERCTRATRCRFMWWFYSYDSYSASDATLKDMVKYNTEAQLKLEYNHYTTKHNGAVRIFNGIHPYLSILEGNSWHTFNKA